EPRGPVPNILLVTPRSSRSEAWHLASIVAWSRSATVGNDWPGLVLNLIALRSPLLHAKSALAPFVRDLLAALSPLIRTENLVALLSNAASSRIDAHRSRPVSRITHTSWRVVAGTAVSASACGKKTAS